MVTLFIVHMANRLVRFAKDVHDIWTETQRLRRVLPGPTEE
jgi:hypothetical protein